MRKQNRAIEWSTMPRTSSRCLTASVSSNSAMSPSANMLRMSSTSTDTRMPAISIRSVAHTFVSKTGDIVPALDDVSLASQAVAYLARQPVEVLVSGEGSDAAQALSSEGRLRGQACPEGDQLDARKRSRR
jgi:hypothetical protein